MPTGRGTRSVVAVREVGFFGADGIVFDANPVTNLGQQSFGSVIHLGPFAIAQVYLWVYNAIVVPLSGPLVPARSLYPPGLQKQALYATVPLHRTRKRG